MATELISELQNKVIGEELLVTLENDVTYRVVVAERYQHTKPDSENDGRFNLLVEFKSENERNHSLPSHTGQLFASCENGDELTTLTLDVTNPQPDDDEKIVTFETLGTVESVSPLTPSHY